MSASIDHYLRVGGLAFRTRHTQDSPGYEVKQRAAGNETYPALSAAKEGALTTRTDDNTGVLTMDSGHGITTGARLDVFWDGGCRRGMTVGTVATNSVPIDGGAGDVLPADESDVTAFVPVELAWSFDGDDVVFAACGGTRTGAVVWADSGNAEIFGTAWEDSNSWQWYDDQVAGGSNPFAGETVAKVFVSNGSSAGTNSVSSVLGG